MALDKQINLFRVDTNAFLNEREKQDKSFLLELQKYKKDLEKIESELEEKLKKDKYNKEILFDKKNIHNKIKMVTEEIILEKKISKILVLDDAIKSVEYNNLNENKIIRNLDEKYLYYNDYKTNEKKINIKNIVSMFESTLSRSFNIKTNELTFDIFIIEIYYYDIAQDLIINGFDYNNKHYVYFSSSAGQIRTKKAVFVEESKYNKCKLKLMCGLTIEKINELGGMNVNKYLAYLALSNSATDLWEDIFENKFDINKSIVVDDFETIVKCKVDNINHETYEIEENVIKDISITHTDGCGMILKSYSEKNFMVRLPFIKGLLGSFDYIKFINQNECSSKVKDIWGKEYDVIKDDIQVIFTKSQLKMYKYYNSWDEYKENFIKYNCEACICNIEEEKISNARINYQMLQTLYNMTDQEIKDICKFSNRNILEISNSLENMLKFFGVYNDDNNNDKKDWFQKSLKIYPELLKDISNKEELKDLRNSLIKKYKSGKLEVLGKFTFVLPDLYAFCEWLFMDNKNPIGLLENGEVFCNLYKNSKELDCLRSPSLYIEHAIRKNVCNKKYRNQKLEDWYCTSAIYTSIYDLISRILQFDVDGDKLLVIAQKIIIDIAKRHMIEINPLFYEMKKAKAEILNNNMMYNGLKLAFTGGNIGNISNDITKIWNQEKIGKEELNAVKWLCAETNYTIDYAKTLYKPTRPEYADKLLKKYHNMKTPYFFYYAKNKKIDQVDDINNSTLNKIVKEIKENKLMFNTIRNLKEIDYKLLLNNDYEEILNEEINNIFIKWNKKYGNNVKFDSDNTDKNNINIIIKEVIKEFHNIEKDNDKILNSLIILLYKNNSSRKKKLLWYIYGEKIYNNLLSNIDLNTEACMKCGKRVQKGKLIRNKCIGCNNNEMKKTGKKIIKCIDCGLEFEVDKNTRTKRCDKCREINNKEIERKKKNNYRKSKMST